MNYDIEFTVPENDYLKGGYGLDDTVEITINGTPRAAKISGIAVIPEDGDNVRIKGVWIETPTFSGVNWDTVPIMHDWVAMDENGRWYSFDYKPVVRHDDEDGGYWGATEEANTGNARSIKLPPFLLDWKDSLFQRPGT